MDDRTLDTNGRRPWAGALMRVKWLAIGAGAALLASAGPLPAALAVVTSGDKPVFVDVTPKRIADTRFDIGIANAVPSGVPKVLQVTGNVPVAPSGSATVVPDGATGVVLNVTAVGPTRSGFVSVRPGNPTSTPTTSNLNVVAGVTIANQVTMGLPVAGANAGDIQIRFEGSGGGSTHILVDVVGYYDHHRHDERYYRQAESRQLVFEHQTLTGGVGFGGEKLEPGPYTSSKTGVGTYSIAYDTDGAGISLGLMPPNMAVTPAFHCPDGTMAMGSWSTYSAFGGLVTSMQFTIETYSHAGAAVDCFTHFQISFGGHTAIEIAEPGVTGSSVSAPDSAIECRNTESGPDCGPLD
jgi:hypothetical protein